MKATTAAVLALSAALASCTRTVIREGAYPPVRVPQRSTGVRENNATLVDASLQGKIAIEASNWDRTATGNAQVWVQIRNRTDYFLQVEARTQFYAASGAPLGKASAWQRIQLGPNAHDTYRENSLQSAVGSYSVEIREGR